MALNTKDTILFLQRRIAMLEELAGEYPNLWIDERGDYGPRIRNGDCKLREGSYNHRGLRVMSDPAHAKDAVKFDFFSWQYDGLSFRAVVVASHPLTHGTREYNIPVLEVYESMLFSTKDEWRKISPYVALLPWKLQYRILREVVYRRKLAREKHEREVAALQAEVQRKLDQMKRQL